MAVDRKGQVRGTGPAPTSPPPPPRRRSGHPEHEPRERQLDDGRRLLVVDPEGVLVTDFARFLEGLEEAFPGAAVAPLPCGCAEVVVR